MGWTLITGASAGIGRELALCFAARGHDLILVARRAERLTALQEQIQRELRVRVEVRPLDLLAPSAVTDLHANLRDLPVDVLVNNAGIGLAGPFLESDRTRQLELVHLNVSVLTELCHLFGNDMRARGSGRILNVSSLAAFQAGPYAAVYYATKAYVQSFSEALREELRGAGVSVTSLCPGPTRTEFQEVAGLSLEGVPASAVMTAEPVARRGAEATLAGRGTVFPSARLSWLAFFSRILPRSWTARLAGRLARRRLSRAAPGN